MHYSFVRNRNHSDHGSTSLEQLKRLIFWMPWPPPWQVWAVAALVVIVAAMMMFTSG
jgi:hypothetical protein